MNKPTNSKQNAIRRQQWNNRKHVWRAEDQLLFWDFCFLCSVPLFLFVVLSTKLTLSNIHTDTKTHANTNTRMNKSIDGMRFFRFSAEVVLLYEKNSTANAPHNISILKRILFLYLYWFPSLDLFRVRLTMLSTIRIDVGWLAGRMVLARCDLWHRARIKLGDYYKSMSFQESMKTNVRFKLCVTRRSDRMHKILFRYNISLNKCASLRFSSFFLSPLISFLSFKIRSMWMSNIEHWSVFMEQL